MIPKFITERIENFKYQDISIWLKDLARYFYNPIILLRKFISSTSINQFNRILFYAILIVIILSFNIKEYEIVNMKSYKIFLSLFLYAFPFIIINFLSINLFKRTNFWQIGKSVFIFTLISSIFSLITFDLFIRNENYSFLFLNTIINVLLFLYLIFIFPIVFNLKTSSKVWSILINILLFNVYTICTIIFFSQDNNPKFTSFDPIVNEYEKSIEDIKTINGEPYSVTQIFFPTKNIEFYNGFTYQRNDTLIRNEDKMFQYFRNIFVNNKNTLSKKADSLHFERNRKAIKFLSTYFDNLNGMFDYDQEPQNLMGEKKYMKKDSIIFIEKEYRINKNILKPEKDFLKIRDEIYDGNEFANKPSYIISFLNLPASCFFYIIDFKIDKDTNIIY